MSEILDYLLQNKKISKEEAGSIITEANKTNVNEEDVILNRRILQGSELLEIKSDIFNLPSVDLFNKEIKKEYLNIISEEIAENYKCIIFNKDGNVLDVAILNPFNYNAKEAIEFITRKKQYDIKYYVTSSPSIKSGLKQYKSMDKKMDMFVGDAKKSSKSVKDNEKAIQISIDTGNIDDLNSPIVKIVTTIIQHAIEEGASDIHIEPTRENTRVRYRIDGDLYTSTTLPKYMHNALIARIKVMSNLKIDETRIPQDGRTNFKFNDNIYDFRISIIPISDGEKVVMRILDTSKKAPTLESLGIEAHNLDLMDKGLKLKTGIILVCGPTGSGKSTTLFSALSILNKEDINIVTLEDPVEYVIGGVNQSQVRPEIGYTFASGIRSFLRQDPDVIMVGEIRDNETAELCVHAGLTGHLVLSTLHTNDAMGAIPRLLDMKIEPFLLSSSLSLITSQRLVRKICKYCKTEIIMDEKVKQEAIDKISKMDKKILKEYGIKIDKDISKIKFYCGKGCAYCNNTGYKGRISIAESIWITDKIKQIIEGGGQSSEIEKELKNQDFISIEQDGIMKAIRGDISLQDVKSAISN